MARRLHHLWFKTILSLSTIRLHHFTRNYFYWWLTRYGSFDLLLMTFWCFILTSLPRLLGTIREARRAPVQAHPWACPRLPSEFSRCFRVFMKPNVVFAHKWGVLSLSRAPSDRTRTRAQCWPNINPCCEEPLPYSPRWGNLLPRLITPSAFIETAFKSATVYGGYNFLTLLAVKIADLLSNTYYIASYIATSFVPSGGSSGGGEEC